MSLLSSSCTIVRIVKQRHMIDLVLYYLDRKVQGFIHWSFFCLQLARGSIALHRNKTLFTQLMVEKKTLRIS